MLIMPFNNADIFRQTLDEEITQIKRACLVGNTDLATT